jgi:hypothetical protein
MDVAVKWQDTAAENEHDRREKRNCRSYDPGGGNGGASHHRSIAVQITVL